MSNIPQHLICQYCAHWYYCPPSRKALASEEKLCASFRRRKEKTMYYRTCPYCGANLDPGERCPCQDETKEKAASDGNRKAANLSQSTPTQRYD